MTNIPINFAIVLVVTLILTFSACDNSSTSNITSDNGVIKGDPRMVQVCLNDGRYSESYCECQASKLKENLNPEKHNTFIDFIMGFEKNEKFFLQQKQDQKDSPLDEWDRQDARVRAVGRTSHELGLGGMAEGNEFMGFIAGQLAIVDVACR